MARDDRFYGRNGRRVVWDPYYNSWMEIDDPYNPGTQYRDPAENQLLTEKPNNDKKPKPPEIIIVSSEAEARKHITDYSGITQIFVQKDQTGKVDYLYCKEFSLKDASIEFEAFKRVTNEDKFDKVESKPATEQQADIFGNPMILSFVAGLQSNLNDLANAIKDLRSDINNVRTEPTANSNVPASTGRKKQPGSRGDCAENDANGAGGQQQ